MPVFCKAAARRAIVYSAGNNIRVAKETIFIHCQLQKKHHLLQAAGFQYTKKKFFRMLKWNRIVWKMGGTEMLNTVPVKFF